jgi:hypothetical protein
MKTPVIGKEIQETLDRVVFLRWADDRGDALKADEVAVERAALTAELNVLFGPILRQLVEAEILNVYVGENAAFDGPNATVKGVAIDDELDCHWTAKRRSVVTSPQIAGYSSCSALLNRQRPPEVPASSLAGPARRVVETFWWSSASLNKPANAVTLARWIRYVIDDECRETTLSVARWLLPCPRRYRVYWGLPRLSKQHPQDAFLLDAPHDVVEGCSCLLPAPSKSGRNEADRPRRECQPST